MVITKDMMYFALVDEVAAVDCIPLHEILQVKRIGSDSSSEQLNGKLTKNSLTSRSNLQQAATMNPSGVVGLIPRRSTPGRRAILPKALTRRRLQIASFKDEVAGPSQLQFSSDLFV